MYVLFTVQMNSSFAKQWISISRLIIVKANVLYYLFKSIVKKILTTSQGCKIVYIYIQWEIAENNSTLFFYIN